MLFFLYTGLLLSGDKHKKKEWKLTQQLQVLCNYLVGRLEKRILEVSGICCDTNQNTGFPQNNCISQNAF